MIDDDARASHTLVTVASLIDAIDAATRRELRATIARLDLLEAEWTGPGRPVVAAVLEHARERYHLLTTAQTEVTATQKEPSPCRD